MANLFAGAASWLLGDNAGNIGNSDVRLLLEALGYATATQFPAGSGGAGREARHRGYLLKAASRFKPAFELAPPHAPAPASFGPEFDPSLPDPFHTPTPLLA